MKVRVMELLDVLGMEVLAVVLTPAQMDLALEHIQYQKNGTS